LHIIIIYVNEFLINSSWHGYKIVKFIIVNGNNEVIILLIKYDLPHHTMFFTNLIYNINTITHNNNNTKITFFSTHIKVITG